MGCQEPWCLIFVSFVELLSLLEILVGESELTTYVSFFLPSPFFNH